MHIFNEGGEWRAGSLTVVPIRGDSGGQDDWFPVTDLLLPSPSGSCVHKLVVECCWMTLISD